MNEQARGIYLFHASAPGPTTKPQLSLEKSWEEREKNKTKKKTCVQDKGAVARRHIGGRGSHSGPCSDVSCVMLSPLLAAAEGRQCPFT